MHPSTRLGRSGVSQSSKTRTMVSTLQLVTVPNSRDSLDTAGGREACSVVSWAQKACQGHLECRVPAAPWVWTQAKQSRDRRFPQASAGTGHRQEGSRSKASQGSSSGRLFFHQDGAQADLRSPACLPWWWISTQQEKCNIGLSVSESITGIHHSVVEIPLSSSTTASIS